MIDRLAFALLGRDRAWRLGRRLYLRARDELTNAMESNGEVALIKAVLAARLSAAPFVAYDVGAKLWTAAVLKAAGDRAVRVEAFEPVPSCHALLARRVGRDPRVHLNEVAISSTAGHATMHVVAEDGGTNSLGEPGEFADGGTTPVDVALITLDEHMASRAIDHIDLLKIDAEGHDIVILRAMHAILAKSRVGVVQFEYNVRWLPNGGSLREVFGLVAALPYVVAHVTERGLVGLPTWNGELDRYFESNYALVHRDLADRLVQSARWSDANTLIDA